MERYIIPKIDPKVFRIKRTNVVENKAQEIQNETTQLPIIIDCKGWPDIPQGIEIWYQNIPFPRKGFPDADIINALNIVKKDVISYLVGFSNKYLIPSYIVFACLPYKWKLSIIEKFAHGIVRKANYHLDFWYYEQQYFCPFANEIYKLINTLLLELRVDNIVSTNLALIGCMFMEHDDRYRIVIQDLFNSMTRQEMMKNPRKAILKMYQLMLERESYQFTQERIGSIFKILSYALWSPKFKKAWRLAILDSDFEKLQFDEGDEYWACTWGNYDAMGLNFEKRQAKRQKWHEGLEPTPYAHKVS